jgi:flagellar motor protein MotB
MDRVVTGHGQEGMDWNLKMGLKRLVPVATALSKRVGRYGARWTNSNRWLLNLVVLTCLLTGGCQQSGNNTNRFASGSLFDFSKRPAWLGGDSRLAKNDRDSRSNQPDGINYDPNGEGGRRLARDYDDLNQRLGAFDNDNQLLNTEVAALQQRLDMANRYNQQLKEQLTGTSGQMSQVFADREAAQQQLASLRMQLEQAQQKLQLAEQRIQSSTGQLVSSGGGAPTQLPGAVMRANNSLLQKVSAIQIRGASTRLDGDVIRIEFPSDTTFVPGTYQIQPSQLPLLQSVASTIGQQFPRQIVGVEAHWDHSVLNSGEITDHQLTATQSLVVFNELVRLGLSRNQLFTMAMGSNRPRHPAGAAGGISPNRRIEIVIYPETFDSN